ncbi:Transthyretin-like protein [Spathaspora passalidarum NRRL Y-27907]|uniref:5-hydroxyisourate hydrolase n=1 Tax=Spathaspora passalidarum (strain NRRL Y-27907 / 11-Y1) TaxID=619300 RepID=G3AKG6_SPAPN|nr:Transthyretin-like protein [Spathaspora passalidarum NRRL Y-27907]EGW32923.1 Transthyretin-like protein [Spathaspora passalidarum NRRL Y-27907]
MTRITTHILNTVNGKPAHDVAVEINLVESNPVPHFTATTNQDGRIIEWQYQDKSTTNQFPSGEYKIKFNTKKYFEKLDQETFYPYVEITFTVKESDEHLHIPLLISNYGYTTYKGS